MSLLTKTTKAAVAAKAAPPTVKGGYRLATPIFKQKARSRARKSFGGLIDSITASAPRTARQLGLVPPKPKRTAPRVAAGIVIGAAGMYLLEPEHGREHRTQLRSLLG